MNVDTAKLRQFIQKHFSAEELRTLLLDYFRPVWEDLTNTMPKQQQVQMLLEYCVQQGKFLDLLAAIQRERDFFQPNDYIKDKQKSEKPLGFFEEARRYAHDFATGKKKSTSNTFSSPVTQEFSTRNPSQIFISHAHQDAEVAQRLAHDLEAHGYAIWIAPDSIQPGEKWVEAINRGLEESGIFVLLLSPEAVASRWVQMETNVAITYNHEDEMQLYPLMLKECRPPALWRAFQHISLRSGYDTALEQLWTVLSGKVGTNELILSLLKEDAQTVTNEIDEAFLLALAQSISPGLKVAYDDEIAVLLNKDIDAVRHDLTFLVNSEFITLNKNVKSPSGVSWAVRLTKSGEKLLEPFQKELEVKVVPISDYWIHPKSGLQMLRIPAGEFLYGDDKEKLYLDEFWIAKTPVTNAEYARFVAATKAKPPKHWQGSSPPAELANHPVVYVSWHDAKAYAEWAGMALPTEQQWQKAARGTDGREYPWGNEWRENHCNTSESGIHATTPVRQFSPQGDSPFGCVDMSGNVWEWTHSRVLCGGSWGNGLGDARVVARIWLDPDLSLNGFGFRVVSPVVSGS